MYDVALKVNEESKRFDLRLNARGTLMVASDEYKLALQVAHAVIREGIISFSLNRPSFVSEEAAIIREALETLRYSILLEASRIPDNLDGFNIYRSEDSISYSKANSRVIKDFWIDEAVTNDKTYYYRVVPVLDGKESFLWRMVAVRPTRVQRKDIYVTDMFTVFEDDRKVIFKFISKKEWTDGEILERIKGVEVRVNRQDPREKTYKILLVSRAGRIVKVVASYDNLYIEGGGN